MFKIIYPNSFIWFSWCNNRLDVYIHDYLVKRDLKATAQAFQAEGKVSSDPVGNIIVQWIRLHSPILNYCFWGYVIMNCIFVFVAMAAIDAPGGFLFEWWSVFWDIFIARTNEKHSEVAASYIEVSLIWSVFFYFFLGVGV